MKLPLLSHCACGRDHTAAALPRVEIGPEVLARTPALMKETFSGDRIHLVWDENTRAAAGPLESLLSQAGFSLSQTRFEDMQWATLEAAEQIRREGDGADVFLAVGTGSLNDLTKYAAFHSRRPAAVFATAPSMDGFLSLGAALYHDGFKDSFDTAAPRLVLGDTGVLAAAPVRLKAAGFGDLLGKYTALCDWEVGRILTGEYWCSALADLTRQSADRAAALCDRIPDRDPDSAGALMEGLCLAGLCMLLCGNSRPASGAEHHFSHYWEMMLIRDGIRPDLHGRKVGVAAAMVADLYRSFLDKAPVFRARPLPEAELAAAFGSLAPEILRENAPDPLAALTPEALSAAWPEIRQAIARVPAGTELAELLSRAGGAVLPQQAGISPELTRQALRWACYVRRRLTLLRVLTLAEQ